MWPSSSPWRRRANLRPDCPVDLIEGLDRTGLPRTCDDLADELAEAGWEEPDGGARSWVLVGFGTASTPYTVPSRPTPA